MSEDKNNHQLQVLENALLETNQKLLEIGATVYDYQPESEIMLNERLNKILGDYKEIYKLKDSLNYKIPVQVLDCIEEDINPDQFSKDFLERTAAENQFTNGKLSAFGDFYESLNAKFNSEFPKLNGK
ncbi:hypothetical protein BB560_002719 [Smittium megazygosporum]|uniref:Mediator of RNA polymerase II transcription subunit 10 n=1 Tax=Smittium megazygosporum TaxID=133381 RepID=A0A2T9ZE09_9FUNG|nr:hypothetical protein BB560_002719 [Smittium megazygosporum]